MFLPHLLSLAFLFSTLGSVSTTGFAATLSKSSHILVLGDSIAEGFGVQREEAYPAVLERLFHEAGYPDIVVINGGVSGATSASGPSRLKWQLKGHPQLMVLELGGNDGLRGVSPEQTRKNLSETVKLAQNSGMTVVLAGMRIPTNYGAEYRAQFERAFKTVAKERKVYLIPFILEGVGGDPQYNQTDGIHPNAKGHELVAKTLFKHLTPMLLKVRA